MDTSEQYVKMCEKAEEIQEHSPHGSQGEFVYCEGETYQEMDDMPLTPFIWLPRQDQLQEMVDDGSSAYGQLGRFYNFVNVNPRLQSSDWTWEQLWLIYVMRWQSNKVWDGENWNTQSST